MLATHYCVQMFFSISIAWAITKFIKFSKLLKLMYVVILFKPNYLMIIDITAFSVENFDLFLIILCI